MWSVDVPAVVASITGACTSSLYISLAIYSQSKSHTWVNNEFKQLSSRLINKWRFSEWCYQKSCILGKVFIALEDEYHCCQKKVSNCGHTVSHWGTIAQLAVCKTTERSVWTIFHAVLDFYFLLCVVILTHRCRLFTCSGRWGAGVKARLTNQSHAASTD